MLLESEINLQCQGNNGDENGTLLEMAKQQDIKKKEKD